MPREGGRAVSLCVCVCACMCVCVCACMCVCVCACVRASMCHLLVGRVKGQLQVANDGLHNWHEDVIEEWRNPLLVFHNQLVHEWNELLNVV